MNLCNSTLGAGCLSLPFAISQAGLGFGTIYLLLTYYCTVISLYYLLKARAITGKTSYEEIIVYIYILYYIKNSVKYMAIV